VIAALPLLATSATAAAAVVTAKGSATTKTATTTGMLGAILTVSAVATTVSSGTALLAAYSLGLGLPFLATAINTDRLLAWLKSVRRIGRWLQIGAGASMVLMGVAMITGMLTTFSFWLLQTFPVFATIG
jgi:cytochrome c-type biogenesis protein